MATTTTQIRNILEMLDSQHNKTTFIEARLSRVEGIMRWEDLKELTRRDEVNSKVRKFVVGGIMGMVWICVLGFCFYAFVDSLIKFARQKPQADQNIIVLGEHGRYQYPLMYVCVLAGPAGTISLDYKDIEAVAFDKQRTPIRVKTSNVFHLPLKGFADGHTVGCIVINNNQDLRTGDGYYVKANLPFELTCHDGKNCEIQHSSYAFVYFTETPTTENFDIAQSDIIPLGKMTWVALEELYMRGVNDKHYDITMKTTVVPLVDTEERIQCERKQCLLPLELSVEPAKLRTVIEESKAIPWYSCIYALGGALSATQIAREIVGTLVLGCLVFVQKKMGKEEDYELRYKKELRHEMETMKKIRNMLDQTEREEMEDKGTKPFFPGNEELT